METCQECVNRDSYSISFYIQRLAGFAGFVTLGSYIKVMSELNNKYLTWASMSPIRQSVDLRI